jgi:hypothetical protein
VEDFKMTFSQWWTFNEGMVTSDRDEGGVYEFANSADQIIYIGSSGQIRSRLKQHLGEDAKGCIKANAAKYRIDYRSDYAAEELRLYDEFVRQNRTSPKCNDIRPPGR